MSQKGCMGLNLQNNNTEKCFTLCRQLYVDFQSHQNKAMSGVLKAVNVVINKGKLPYELKEARPRSCRLIAR